jgi:hypothetical protein
MSPGFGLKKGSGMSRWPWVTAVLAAAAAASPLGQEVIHSAFISGDQLARNIWQPIFFTVVAAVIVLMVIEWALRIAISRWRDQKQVSLSRREKGERGFNG